MIVLMPVLAAAVIVAMPAPARAAGAVAIKAPAEVRLPEVRHPPEPPSWR